jgi:hypothetical protein
MRLSSLALAGALAVSVAGASLAQPAPGPASPEGRGWQRPDPAQMAANRTERLRAILQLRPDQEPALHTFVTAMQPSAEQLQRREAARTERAEARNLTTPQRLDRMQARLAERQAAFARRSDAIKRFYAQLTPAQQRAFDALPMGRGDGRGHGRGGFGRGEHPGFG